MIVSLIFVPGPSYNQPKLSPCATWNPNAITFANSTFVGTQPRGIHVDINNTLYMTARSLNQILVWPEGSDTPTRFISGNLNIPYGIFVTINGDIYVDNGEVNGRVDKWSLNANSSVAVMNVTSRCMYLFVDINQTLYCANDYKHQVVKLSLTSGSNIPIIIAGNGTLGSLPHMLHLPNGIFVDRKFNLYVADYGNNRIQLFRSGQQNGITVVGNGALGTVTLHNPTGVILDADDYLFIVDHSNHRIIRSGPFGYSCLLGCASGSGVASKQLNYPWRLSFDSHGNLFVVDNGNNRIQKFLLTTNSCGKFY